MSIDLNKLIFSINFSVFGFFVILIFQITQNSSDQLGAYINIYTLIKGVIISCVSMFFLALEKRKKNPFLIIIIGHVTLYYLLRIISLNYTDYSVNFEVFNVTDADVSYTLSVVLLLYTSLLSGFHLCKFEEKWFATGYFIGPVIASILLFFGFFIILFNFILPNFPLYINSHNGLFCVFSAAFFSQSLTRGNKILFFVTIAFYVISNSILGSRSAILACLELWLVFYLLREYRTKFFVSWGVVAASVLLAAGALLAFWVVSFWRLGESFNFSADNFSRIPVEFLFARLGFLDFSVPLIAMRDMFIDLLGFSHYFQSIITFLMPFVDTFDRPLTGNILQFSYRLTDEPSRKVVAEFYHSDQLGIFAEIFLQFEYWGVIMIFFVGVIFRTVLNLRVFGQFFRRFHVAISFLCFFWFLKSFGIDWILMNVIVLYLVGFCFQMLIAISKSWRTKHPSDSFRQ